MDALHQRKKNSDRLWKFKLCMIMEIILPVFQEEKNHFSPSLIHLFCPHSFTPLEHVRKEVRKPVASIKIAQYYDYYYTSQHNKHKLRAVIIHVEQHIINLFLAQIPTDFYSLYSLEFRQCRLLVVVVLPTLVTHSAREEISFSSLPLI
jgi:hypothetical protein